MNYSDIILEQVIKEIGFGPSALIGAGVGAATNIGLWIKKRADLKNKLKNCGNDENCKKYVSNELVNLNKNMMKNSIIGTAGGAVAGAGVKYLSKPGTTARSVLSTVGNAAGTGLNTLGNVAGNAMQIAGGIGASMGLAQQVQAQSQEKPEQDNNIQQIRVSLTNKLKSKEIEKANFEANKQKEGTPLTDNDKRRLEKMNEDIKYLKMQISQLPGVQ